MPVPDPNALIGKSCSLILRNGSFVVRTIVGVSKEGLVVEEFGQKKIYTFAEIDRVNT